MLIQINVARLELQLNGRKAWHGHFTSVEFCATAGLVVFLVVSLGCPAGFAAESKRVMLLHSFGRDFKPWSEYAKTIRAELDRQSPWPLDIIENSLVSARFSDENAEAPFVEYLRTLFAKYPLDLIVSIGAPAANFVQRHRQQLFLTTPMIFTTVEQRRIQFANLTENDSVVAVAHDFPAIIENILRVLPDTKTIAVVNGNSSLEKLWLQDMQKEFAPFADRVSFIWWNDRSFEEILKQAAALPPHSAIFWHLMNVDAAGIQHEGERALARLYAVANAPIFSYADVFFGRELVGGPMHSVLEGAARQPPPPFVSSAARSQATSRYPPPDLPRPSSTGGKCSAGASARKTCRRAAKSCFVTRRHGNNIALTSWQSSLQF